MESDSEFDVAGWSSYFDVTIQLLEEADRQYGVANQQYMQYVFECLKFSVHTCRIMRSQWDLTGLFNRTKIHWMSCWYACIQ